MKRILFFTLLLTICCGAVFGQPKMTIVFDKLDLTSVSYQPEAEIPIGYEAFNSAQRELTMHCTFKLYLEDELIFTQERNNIIIPNITPSVSSFVPFTFPANCQIPAGDYELQLAVNFSQSPNPSQVRVSIRYGAALCDEVTIPANSSDPSPDCPEVFVEPLNFLNSASCCTFDPAINITVTPFDLTWPPKLLRCDYDVSVDVVFDDEGTEYTLLWSHGNTGSTFSHNCGTREYTVTVFWEQMGEACSKTSDPITVMSHCDCAPATLLPPPGPPPFPSSEEDANANTLTIKRSVQMAPNPNRGQFHLQFSDETEVRKIEVWNMMGQIIWEQSGPFSRDFPIDLSQASPGTYHLAIHYTDKEQKLQRFIIQ
ncbi:MAG: T9SS type A sorting domain-containing protein [Bacteroidota bacterium]